MISMSENDELSEFVRPSQSDCRFSPNNNKRRVKLFVELLTILHLFL